MVIVWRVQNDVMHLYFLITRKYEARCILIRISSNRWNQTSCTSKMLCALIMNNRSQWVKTVFWKIFWYEMISLLYITVCSWIKDRKSKNYQTKKACTAFILSPSVYRCRVYYNMITNTLNASLVSTSLIRYLRQFLTINKIFDYYCISNRKKQSKLLFCSSKGRIILLLLRFWAVKFVK